MQKSIAYRHSRLTLSQLMQLCDPNLAQVPKEVLEEGILRHYFGKKAISAKQRLMQRAVESFCAFPSGSEASDNLRKVRDYALIMKDKDSESFGRALVKLRNAGGRLPKGFALSEDVFSTIKYLVERFPEIGARYGITIALPVEEIIPPVPLPALPRSPIYSDQNAIANGVIPESLPRPSEIPLPGLVVVQDIEAPGFGSEIVLECFDDNDGAVGQIIARRPQIDIGRAMQSNIIISDMSVSRQHARIEISENGAIMTDLGSDNSTFINDERLSGAAAELHNDDLVVIGPVYIRVKQILIQPPALQAKAQEQSHDVESLKARFRMPKDAEESKEAIAKLSAIVEQLEDDEALFYVAMHCEDGFAGEVAVAKLDDPQTLMSIAFLSSNKSAREAVVRKLADRKLDDIMLYIAEQGDRDTAQFAVSLLPSTDKGQTQKGYDEAPTWPSNLIKSSRLTPKRRYERSDVHTTRNAESIEALVHFVESMNQIPNNPENIKKAKERLAKGFEDVMRITPELVMPKHWISVKNGGTEASYTFADFFTDGHDRPMALTYMGNSTGEVRIAITYLSSSQAAWRILTDISYIYGKGKHGEHTITLPFEVQQELDLRCLLRMASSELLPVQNPAGIVLNAFEDEDFIEKKVRIDRTMVMEISKPSDVPKVEDNRRFVGLDGKPLPDETIGQRTVMQVNPVDYQQIESFLRRMPAGWLPRYERGIELVGDAYSPLYGNFKRVALPSKDRMLRYVFNVTSIGTFLAAIESPHAKINKYGLSSWVPVKLFPDTIMTPVVEYPQNIEHHCLESGVHFKGSYFFVKNHHNRISLLRDASDFFGYLEAQLRRENGGPR